MAGVSWCKGVLFFASVGWECVCVCVCVCLCSCWGLFRNGASVPSVRYFRLFCSEDTAGEDFFDYFYSKSNILNKISDTRNPMLQCAN